MPSEHSPDVRFEIGHVLFIDIVGYSKLLINEQSEQMQKLKQVVRGTEQFRLAEARANCCVYRLAMVAHLFSAPVLKRRFSARLRLARNSNTIPNFRCEWEFTAARSMKSLI